MKVQSLETGDSFINSHVLCVNPRVERNGKTRVKHRFNIAENLKKISTAKKTFKDSGDPTDVIGNTRQLFPRQCYNVMGKQT